MTELVIDPELALVIERWVPVQADKVWRAWTTTALLEQWFCPRPWRAAEFEIDLRPGGAYNCTMFGPGGEVMPNRGCVLQVIPGRRLVTTDALTAGFRPTGSGFLTAYWTVETDRDGARYVAVAKHATTEAVKQHEQMGFRAGWSPALPHLVELMQRPP